MNHQWLPTERTELTEPTTIPARKVPDWWPGVGKFLTRLLLGILAAGAVGIGSVACRFAGQFGLSVFRVNSPGELFQGVAIVSFYAIAAMLPGILILLILDQCSERFRRTPWRPLYAGLIGLLVILGWSVFFGFRHWSQVDSFTIIFPIACFLSGATFAKIVTFPHVTDFTRVPTRPNSSCTP
jgi:hypothetical protein